MSKMDKQKRKILSYFGTKKYKLSFWGFTPHFDWYMLIFYFFIGIILIFTFGYIKNYESMKSINKEIVSERENIKKIDLIKFKKTLQDSYGFIIEE